MSVAEIETRELVLVDESNAEPWSTYLGKISRKPFLTVREEQELGPSIQMYRQVVRAVMPQIPMVRGEKIPREEKAEGYILRVIQDASKAYPTPDFYLLVYVVDRGRAAIERLMEANYRLVVGVAMHYKDYCTSGLGFWDLINAGNLKLRQAALNFDHTLGFRFTTYADACINEGIKREINDCSRPIRLPSDRVYDLARYVQTRAALRREKQIEPSSEEVAKKMKITPLRLKHIRANESMIQVVSLDAAAFQADSSDRNHKTKADLTTSLSLLPDDQYTQHELRLQIFYALNSAGLNTRAKEILLLRNGFTDGRVWSRQDVGKYFGISREWVRLLEVAALERLKENTTERLVAYL